MKIKKHSLILLTKTVRADCHDKMLMKGNVKIIRPVFIARYLCLLLNARPPVIVITKDSTGRSLNYKRGRVFLNWGECCVQQDRFIGHGGGVLDQGK